MTPAKVLAVVLGAMAFLVLPGRAQVQVDISFKRTLYMLYEPIICTVTITNLTGATLDLSDTPRDKWFGFQIESVDGRPLAPVNPDYHNEPVQIAAGQRLTRSINLTPLYPLSEFGTFRVRGAVFPAQLGRYFISQKQNIDITEGRLLWQQSVGVPEGAGSGRTRSYSILAHRLPQATMLYLRVEDRDAGIVFCTTQIGRFITFGNPDVELDSANQIHILQNTAPKSFLYSHFDVNGKILSQKGYMVANARPYLAKKGDSVVVVGGVPFNPNEKPPEQALPKMHDRPVPLPTPQGKPTPEDKRPKNLLSEP